MLARLLHYAAIVLSLLLMGSNVAAWLQQRSVVSDSRQRHAKGFSPRLEALSDSANNYVDHWSKLLLAEQLEAVAELRARRKAWSRKKLEDSGLSVFDAVAEPESDLFGEKIVRIYKEGETRLRDRFSRGDLLVMTRVGRAMARNQVLPPKECCVVDVGTDWMSLAVGPSWPPGLWETRRLPNSYAIRLDRTAPKAPLRAQQVALELTRKGEAGEAAALLVDSFCDYGGDAVQRSSCTPSRFRDWSESELDEAVAIALQEAKNSTSFDPNNSQQNAISWALRRQASLLIGPPGTGKTRVAALLISTAMRMRGLDSKQQRVLAVAHSNGAADVLLEALLQIGIPAVRAGRPASVSPSVRHRTAIAIADRHPEVIAMRQKSFDLSLESHVRSRVMTETKLCISDVCQSILKTAPVVVASCVGAHQLLEEGSYDIPSFPLVVVDEAAQTTEPGLLCALSAARAEQIILVGDTRQLPPTVASETPEIRDNLGISPMARLESKGVDQWTLRLQYRMAPALLEHPSQYFYDGLVTCASEISGYSPPQGFPWPKPEAPLAFIQVGVNLEVAHEFGGKSNPVEALLVVDIVQRLVEAGDVEATGIAVISPYSKQVQRLRNEMAIRNIRDVRVGTVDSFQGQETDVVIFSAVRSNSDNEMGFLRDPRRLCVAITRARRGLVVVGDKKVLRTSHHWNALIVSCDERGCSMDAEDIVPSAKEKQQSLTGKEAPMVNGRTKHTPVRDRQVDAETDMLLDTLLDKSDELLGLFDNE